MSWTYVVLGLMLLIFVHELGHFVVARLVGAKATRFLVGFPPVALSFTRGETEYGLGAIPLGGYVRIVGMNRPQTDDVIVCKDAIEEINLRRPDGQRDLFGSAVAALKGALMLGAGPDAQVAADRALLALDADQDLLHPETLKHTKKDLTRLRDDLDESVEKRHRDVIDGCINDDAHEATEGRVAERLATRQLTVEKLVDRMARREPHDALRRVPGLQQHAPTRPLASGAARELRQQGERPLLRPKVGHCQT